MRPLTITYTLAAPVVCRGSPIHLDALLAWVKIRHATHGAGARSVAWEPDEPIGLPLGRMSHGEHWWYRSSAVWPDGERSRMSWTKKWDRDHESRLDLGKASQVTLKLGRYKEAHVPMEVVHVPEMVFYAVGDRRAVKKLAKRLTHIGAKASQGYGLVRKCVVEALDVDEFETDWDWRTPDNRPARNLPLDFAVQQGLDVRGMLEAPITPPYWRILEQHVTEVAW